MEKSLISIQREIDNWISSIDLRHQKKFKNLINNSFTLTDIVRQIHLQRFHFGYNLAGFKFKDKVEYLKEELYNTYRELSKSNLIVKWKNLQILTDVLKQRIENTDKKSSNIKLFLIEDEDEYTLLFWIVVSPEGNLDYLSIPLDLEFPDKSLVIIPAMNDFIDFIGMFLFMIELLNYALFNEYITRLNPPKRKLIPKTFQGLFRNPKNAQIVKEILERNEYTVNGQWHGLTPQRSELLCAYYVLIPILRPGEPTSQGRTFYREFGLPDDYISSRMITNEPLFTNKSRIEFERIFSHLIPK